MNDKALFEALDYVLSQHTSTSEIDYLLSQHTDLKLLDELVSERTKNAGWNATQRWLYDGSAENFERAQDYCLKKALHDEGIGNLSEEEYVDHFSDWHLDLCRKDNLASFLEEGKEIKMSVLYWWFRQFVHRATMIEAQDAHGRSRGARTQTEVIKGKTFNHDPKKMGESGMSQASILIKKDKETGFDTGEIDYYHQDSSNEAESLMEEQSLYAHVKEILVERYGEDGEARYELFEQMMEGKVGGFESKDQWADYWKIPRATLKKQIEGVRSTLERHREDLGV
jgi:hypothetical protein